MSATSAEPAPQPGVKSKSTALRTVLLCVLAVPLVAFIAAAANAVRLEQQTEQARRQIGAAGGKSTTERRVPGWVAAVFGPGTNIPKAALRVLELLDSGSSDK